MTTVSVEGAEVRVTVSVEVVPIGTVRLGTGVGATAVARLEPGVAPGGAG